MDVPIVIRRRLVELGLEQRDLARAAGVTESYISQLLTRKKAPPAPSRTDIYDRMDAFLKLPSGELARLALAQRKEQLKRELGDEPAPLFHQVRELLLRKCDPVKEPHVRAIVEQQPFGELERLVTQKLLDVVKRVAKGELQNDYWLRMVAQLSGRSYEEMRVIVLDFLDTDVFHLSAESCVAFLDPLIQSWDIDLATFSLDITLNHHVVPGEAKRFEFVEREAGPPEPGLQKFLQDPALSGSATLEEVEFLKRLLFAHKRPTPLFYYRALQSLRDPLHFGLIPESLSAAERGNDRS
ncbi:MAG TPA: helix-turn-helix transcriptional regulator [Gemmatimonadales bacterium]|nr:helix-turn-helix transcriptional regulator [Gemmatimonadales bacterium]